MIRLTRKSEYLISIDLGRRSIKAALLSESAGSITVHSSKVIEVPAAHDRQAASLFKLALDNIKPFFSRTRKLAVVLPTGSTPQSLKDLPFSRLPELRNIVEKQASTIFHGELPDHIFDYAFPLSATHDSAKRTSKNKALVCALPNSLVTELQAIAAQYKCNIRRLTHSPSALLNFYSFAEKSDHAPVAFLDIGQDQSIFMLFHNRDVMVLRSLPIGGAHLTQAIAENRNLPPNLAESLKQTMPESVEHLLREDPLARLLSEIQLSIQFFETKSDLELGGLYISGATAQSEKIISWVEKDFGRPLLKCSQAAEEFIHLTPQKGTESLVDTSQLAVVIGAAIPFFFPKNVSVNFLADVLAQDQAVPLPLRFVVPASVAATLLLLAWGTFERIHARHTVRELASISEHSAAISKSFGLTRSNALRLDQLDQWLSALDDKARNRFLCAPVLDALQRLPLDNNLVFQSLNLREDLVTASAAKSYTNKAGRIVPSSPSRNVRRNVITIEAKQTGKRAPVENFIQALGSNPWFQSNLRPKDPILLRNVLEDTIERKGETLISVEAYAEKELK
jgi:Tfp pilus assembly PilM family ATPase